MRNKGLKSGIKLRLLRSIACIFLLSACGVGRTTDYTQGNNIVTNYTQCVLPADQGTGSLKGSWAHLPVPIVFDQDFYIANNGEAIASLKGAVNTWNAWAALRGFQAFSIVNDGPAGSASAGMAIPDLTATCSQAMYTASVTTKVGIWKIRSSGDGANYRTSCSTSGGLLMSTGIQGSSDWITSGGHISGASILLNFDGFNTPGKTTLDLESLLLHELGHVLGLLHSCNGSSATSTDLTSAPACAIADSSYITAVMFPILGASQLRRSLKQNDYSRVNCLY